VRPAGRHRPGASDQHASAESQDTKPEDGGADLPLGLRNVRLYFRQLMA
jgi:hypothetical protein